MPAAAAAWVAQRDTVRDAAGRWRLQMTDATARFVRWGINVLGALALLWLMPWAFLAGNMMARIDIARGHTQAPPPPPLNPWTVCDATALQGTEVLSAALCGITSVEARYELGYGAVMHQAMRPSRGPNAHVPGMPPGVPRPFAADRRHDQPQSGQ